MNGWGLLLVGTPLGVIVVCRLLHLGRARLLPVAALALGLLIVATPPGRQLSGLLGAGLVVVVQLLAWVAAPLVTLGLLVLGIVALGRRHPAPGSPGRVASVLLTLTLGIAAALVLVHLPALPAVGRQLTEAAAETGAGLLDTGAVVVLTGLEGDG